MVILGVRASVYESGVGGHNSIYNSHPLHSVNAAMAVQQCCWISVELEIEDYEA